MKTYGLVAMSASCEDLSSGHYYAIGRRSEPTSSGDLGWYAMDDSQVKAGNSPEKLLDDNACVANRLRQHLTAPRLCQERGQETVRQRHG